MRPGQLATWFDMLLRAKYRYGLIIIGTEEGLLREDMKWEEVAINALLKAGTMLGWKRRLKRQALLQLGGLEWVAEKEAERTVTKWENFA